MLLVESPVSASFFTSQEPNQRPRPAQRASHRRGSRQVLRRVPGDRTTLRWRRVGACPTAAPRRPRLPKRALAVRAGAHRPAGAPAVRAFFAAKRSKFSTSALRAPRSSRQRIHCETS